jgi:predicted regulator of Ras-like GTPase activity (Roadblock/LC7/MglB family)
VSDKAASPGQGLATRLLRRLRGQPTTSTPEAGSPAIYADTQVLDIASLPAPATPTSDSKVPMSNLDTSLQLMMQIDGALAVAVVDSNSGMALGKAGGGVNLDLAAAGNTEVLRAKLKTMKSLGLNDTLEDMLITLGQHYHIIRPIPALPGLFVYLVLDKARANLAMARYKVADAEKSIKL